MKKQLHYLITSFAVLISITASFHSASAQVLHTESFDTQFLPQGWVAVGAINSWSFQTNGTQPTCIPHSGAGMARFSRNAPANSSQTFSTPIIDYSSRGVDTPRVSFWIFRDGGAAASAEAINLYVNTTPTMNAPVYLGTVARSRTINFPDTQAVNGWYRYTFNIPPAFNTGSNYILFTGASDVNQGNNIFIDDIQYDSYPTACTGSPTPGHIVANDTVLCGGTGSTILSLSGQATDTGITVQWKSSLSSSGPWTDFGNSVTSISTGTITATTYYYAVLTCNASLSSDSTPVITITVDAGTPPVVSVVASNNGNHCAAVPVTLTASGATYYSWSPATGLDTTSGSVVQASPTGDPGFTIMYTVTGANAAGCSSTDSVLVTNHTTNTVTIQALPGDTICTGQQLTLNAIASMGPQVTDYLWTPGGATTPSITVSPGADTIYSVTITNNWGCTDSDSLPITIVAGTVPVITSVTADPPTALYCTGGAPVILHVTGTGGTVFSWSPANGLNTTSGDSVVSTPQGGFGGGNILYTVTLTSPSGCSAFDTIRVRRANPPTVFPTATDTLVCSGDSTTLNAVVFGMGDTFLWTPGGFTTQSITVAPSVPTLYNVHVVSGASGCSRDTGIQIAVTPGPVAAFGYTIPPGQRTVTFHDSSSNAIGYEWLFGDGNLSTLQNPVYTYGTNGSFIVKLIVTNGNCSPDTAYATINFTVGIDELNSSEIISIAPNPTDNIAVVQFRSAQKITLQVVNALGEVMSERTINSAGNGIHTEEIDMHKFAAGIYMIHIISGQNNISRKLVKF